MTRTSSLRVLLIAALVVALATTPAMASGRSAPDRSIVGAGNESRALIAASSQPSDPQGPRSEVVSGHGYGSPNPNAPYAVVQGTTSDGLDWRSALIGALAGTALMLLAAGTVHAVSRARRRTAKPSV